MRLLVMVMICLMAVPSQAAWTKWFDMNNREDVAQLNKLAKGRGGTLISRIKCKMDGGLKVRVDYRRVYGDHIYYVGIDSKKRVDAEFAKFKKRGAKMLSRSDVQTSKGTMSCYVWRIHQY